MLRRRNIESAKTPKFDINDVQLKKISFKHDRQGLNELDANVFQRDKDLKSYIKYGDLSMKAIYKGKMVGAVLLDSRNDTGQSYLYVAAIATHRDFRSKQIGAKMMNYIKNIASSKAKTHSDIKLHVDTGNLRAQAFYTRHGFQQGPQVANYYAIGRPALEYSFPIPKQKK